MQRVGWGGGARREGNYSGNEGRECDNSSVRQMSVGDEMKKATLSNMSFCFLFSLLVSSYSCYDFPFPYIEKQENLTISSCCFFAELYSRQSIQNSKLISNPGCYATSIQALIAPLVPYLDPQAPPTVFGISGYSGAGTKAAPSGTNSSGGSSSTTSGTIPKISPQDLQGGIRPYSLTDHIHEREASRHLQQLFSSTDKNKDFKIAFVPAVAPWFQGIISTMSAPLSTTLTAKNVRQLYEEFYAEMGDLVEIGTKVPEITVSLLFKTELSWLGTL